MVGNEADSGGSHTSKLWEHNKHMSTDSSRPREWGLSNLGLSTADNVTLHRDCNEFVP